MKRILFAAAMSVAGCALPPPQAIDDSIQGALAGSEERRKPSPPPAVEQALMPPLRMEMPKAGGQPIDQRFDLSVNNAPATQVFTSLVAGTRYSMLVHPAVTGNITVNLKDVTLREALDSLRELYGFEYKFEGTRIFVEPAGIQARVFQVNYLAGQRRGLSQLRVSGQALTDTYGGTGTTPGLATPGAPVMSTGAAAIAAGSATLNVPGGAPSRDTARVTTNQEALFWSDLCEALVALVFPSSKGDQSATPNAAAMSGSYPASDDHQRSMCNRRHAESNRSIVVSPHSGVIVVRATPAELRAVESYLRASRLAVERQVMLEAKIIEVTLANQFQSGINWAAFGRQFALGQVTRQSGQTIDPTLPIRDQLRTGAVNQVLLGNPNAPTSTILTGASGAVVGLGVAAPHFAALLTFLETQGKVQVLSSPRVATLNNQKAVLKVGQDELFVSNITVTPPTVGTVATPATVAPQFAPYFSGIVLDVTPQIDDQGNITLHIHPSINDIIEVNRSVDLGSAGQFSIPTARNTIRETDTIVRVMDGNIVAIGGLMRTEVNDVRGGIPGTPDTGPMSAIFRSTNRLVEKKELVILLKPTIVESDREWTDDLRQTRERLDTLGREMGAGTIR